MHLHHNQVIRSFASERRLIGERDIDALWIKYRARLPNVSRLAAFLEPYEDEQDPNPAVFEPVKDLGVVTVKASQGSPVAAKGGPYVVQLGDANVNMLHIDNFEGAGQFRADMAAAAGYIGLHQELRERPITMGVSYREMTRLSERMGFLPMEVTEVQEEYWLNVQASHMVFSAFNGNRERPYELRAVYLPTDEFADVFPPAG